MYLSVERTRGAGGRTVQEEKGDVFLGGVEDGNWAFESSRVGLGL